nr:Gag-Pol polyprotein [Tanacetum cinerariifolium]
MKVKESLNVTFDKSPPPIKLSPLDDDDVGEEDAIKNYTKVVNNNNNNKDDESIEVDEVVNIKESKNHSLDQIPLLYRGEYSQWREWFMNYLKEQTDGEAMINSIQNGDQPLPVIAQVSLDGNAQNAPSTLKDPNDEIAKDLWDALERQMRGSEYGEQDRKAAILYEYETFKAIKGEQLLDTYLRYLQVIKDLKKCGYKKDNCELYYKFLNNLQPEWKQYGTLMRQTKNLMDINIDALYNILNQNQGDVNDALGYKKKAVVVTSDPLALVAEKTKVSKRKKKVVVSSDSKGSGANDFSELKKIIALLEKAFNLRKFYSKPINNNLRTSSTS